jgi:hypothetical protein
MRKSAWIQDFGVWSGLVEGEILRSWLDGGGGIIRIWGVLKPLRRGTGLCLNQPRKRISTGLPHDRSRLLP